MSRKKSSKPIASGWLPCTGIARSGKL